MRIYGNATANTSLKENTAGIFAVKDKIDVAKRVNKIEQRRVRDKRIRISFYVPYGSIESLDSTVPFKMLLQLDVVALACQSAMKA